MGGIPGSEFIREARRDSVSFQLLSPSSKPCSTFPAHVVASPQFRRLSRALDLRLEPRNRHLFRQNQQR